MSINESDIFEENKLFIQGTTLKLTINKITDEFNHICELFEQENLDSETTIDSLK